MPRRSTLILAGILLAGALAPARFEPPADGLVIVDWAEIESQIQQHQHSAVLQKDASYRARHHRFDWTLRFDGRGLEVEPDEGDWTWGLELVGFGVEGAVAAVERQAKITVDKNRVSYAWGDGVEEWYVTEGRGIEHGFTLQRRPSDVGGRLVFELEVRGGLDAREAGGRGLRFEGDSGEEVVRYDGLKVWDAAGVELPARLEVGSDERVVILVDDDGARYPITVDPIIQRSYLKASNTGWRDKFGYSVAVSGDTVVVGAPDEDGSATVVNGPDDDQASGSGAAYVFERIGGIWRQQAYLKAANRGREDGFGYSVAVSDDTAVVGAYLEDGSGTGVGPPSNNNARESGAAYVFDRTGGTWSQRAYLKASNTDRGDFFGRSVAVSGDLIIVGAFSESGSGTGVNPPDSNNGYRSGAAYVFERMAGVWSQRAYLKASNTNLGDNFGWSMAISGETIVIGAPQEGGGGTGVNPPEDNRIASNSGAAYVFERMAGVWSQKAYLKASNADAWDAFGSVVAISEDTIVVGASAEDGGGTGANPPDDNSLNSSGAVYVFQRTAGGWIQQAYLKASTVDSSDGFGSSVAISGDRIVVAARGEDGSGIGTNPPDDNGVIASGAAYLFERVGQTWGHRVYLKASNTGAHDEFGSAAAVSGDTVVVVARSEDGSGTGTNPPDDNGAEGSGAAYVFEPARPPILASFTYGYWIVDRNDDGVYDPIEEIFGWGVTGSTPLKGDWNGDGYLDFDVFSNGLWFLDLNGDRLFDPATEIKGWGLAGWTPVTGDWNGDGVTDVGAIEPATMTWFLDLNGDLAFDPATEIVGWGSPGNQPMVGDWDGDGDDDIAVFADGIWFRDVNRDRSFDPGTEIKGWGVAGWTPVVGDWDGDGGDDIGAIDPSTMMWFVDLNGDCVFDPGTEMVGWGSPGNRPVVADWDGDSDDDIGVVAGRAWFIDGNGDRQFDPATEIRGWGDAGWLPVPGPWK